MLSSEYLDHFMKDDFDQSLSSTTESEYLSLVVLHLGVVRGSFDAAQSLGYRYMNGVGVPEEDREAAAYYYSISVRRASDFFHKVGGQPIVEVCSLKNS